MVFNDLDAYENYPNFVDTINGIVAPERLSETRQESARKFQIYMKTFGRLNEATFLRVIWPLLMKDGYHAVKERADFTEEEKEILRDEKNEIEKDDVEGPGGGRKRAAGDDMSTAEGQSGRRTVALGRRPMVLRKRPMALRRHGYASSKPHDAHRKMSA